MNKWIKLVYNNLNLYERNVFECFYDIHSIRKRNVYLGLIDNLNAVSAFLYCRYQKNRKKDIYLKYLEVPITTKCTLNCRECNNLIQFYQNPVNFDALQIIKDIKKICSLSAGIKKIRILGGEPLCHKELAKILRELKKIDNINQIQVVTNATLVFDVESLAVLRNKKFSVDISNYGKHSCKYNEVIEQLKRHNIRYVTQNEQKPWKSLCHCRCRNRSGDELNRIFSMCRQDCLSLLDGELHICARSSHGTDLGLIEKKDDDFVAVRKISDKNELKRRIYELLNKDCIAACNYCDMFQLEKMPSIPSAEQMSKKEGKQILEKWKTK